MLGSARSSLQSTQARSRRRSEGFSIIELVVVIGVVLVLMGLFSGSILGTFRQTKLTRSAATIRQNAMMLLTYVNEAKEVFPRSEGKPYNAGIHWYRPLIDAGYAKRAVEFDPDFHHIEGRPTYAMSEAMVLDPQIMKRGQTLPRILQRTSDVKLSQVLMPSQKGMLYQFFAPFDGRPPDLSGPGPTNVWCCGFLPAPKTPVAMTDGSIVIGAWNEFLPEGVLDVVDDIGRPVLTTWDGVTGRDKP